MSEITALQGEIESLDAEYGALRSEIESHNARASALRRRIESLRAELFEEEFTTGKFALNNLTPETFAELMELGHGSGQSSYSRLKDHVSKFHPQIRMSGTYIVKTGQNVFEVRLNYRQPIEDSLVDAVKRISELSILDGDRVHWSIFDRRLSEDGIHGFYVYPEDWTAQINVTRYGAENPEERKPLIDVLAEVAEEHWYEGGPSGYDY